MTTVERPGTRPHTRSPVAAVADDDLYRRALTPALRGDDAPTPLSLRPVSVAPPHRRGPQNGIHVPVARASITRFHISFVHHVVTLSLPSDGSGHVFDQAPRSAVTPRPPGTGVDPPRSAAFSVCPFGACEAQRLPPTKCFQVQHQVCFRSSMAACPAPKSPTMEDAVREGLPDRRTAHVLAAPPTHEGQSARRDGRRYPRRPGVRTSMSGPVRAQDLHLVTVSGRNAGC